MVGSATRRDVQERAHVTAGQMRFAMLQQCAQAIEPGVLQCRADHEHLGSVAMFGDALAQPITVRSIGARLQIDHQQRSRRLIDGLPEAILLAVVQIRLAEQRFDALLQTLGRCPTTQAGADKQNADVGGLAHDGLQNGPAV